MKFRRVSPARAHAGPCAIGHRRPRPVVRAVLAAVAGVLLAQAASAQQAPDAGQTLRQQQLLPPQPPRPSSPPTIAEPAARGVAGGGPRVQLREIELSGHTAFDTARLLEVIGAIEERPYDLDSLQALADRVTAFYRAQGYPFALAYVPAQTIAAGRLRIEVVEGRWGRVTARGDADLRAAAEPYLAALKPGAVITARALERSVLLVEDLPGVRVRASVSPGAAGGEGDLTLDLAPGERLAGELGLENHGNRYTGAVRARAQARLDRVWTVGDRLTAQAMVSDAAQRTGGVGYSLPWGGDGLRLQFAASRATYELGKEFAGLRASGTADVVSVGLSHPWLRSARSNLRLEAAWQHKRLDDRQAATGTGGRKRSDALPVILGFDHRDGLAGGGVTYGSVALTSGTLHLGESLKAADAAGARTDGRFVKLGLDVARLQAIGGPLALSLRAAAQVSDRNLDSSEDFALGGVNGVRAYPSGEGFGDQGWLVQTELRWTQPGWTAYALYDEGRIRVNRKPWSPAVDQRRHLAGAGVGMRWEHGAFAIDGSLAWRLRGGRSLSDPGAGSPQGWVFGRWRF